MLTIQPLFSTNELITRKKIHHPRLGLDVLKILGQKLKALASSRPSALYQTRKKDSAWLSFFLLTLSVERISLVFVILFYLRNNSAYMRRVGSDEAKHAQLILGEGPDVANSNSWMLCVNLFKNTFPSSYPMPGPGTMFKMQV